MEYNKSQHQFMVLRFRIDSRSESRLHRARCSHLFFFVYVRVCVCFRWGRCRCCAG